MSIVVEVGAYTGIETLNFLSDTEAKVFAFEPRKLYFIDLYKMSNSYPRLTALPFAVDIGDNQEPLWHNEDGLSSLQPADGIGSLSKPFEFSWTIRLDTFMKLFSIDKIDYLRIDAPHREEMCLESLAERATDVERGRIRCYDESKSVIVTWLYDHGFNLAQDALSNDILNPDIRFWR